MSLDTTNWAKYPFTVEGVDFISMLDTQSKIYKVVSQISADDFANLNKDAVQTIIGNPSLLTRDELLSELDRVNDGASHALIVLA